MSIVREAYFQIRIQDPAFNFNGSGSDREPLSKAKLSFDFSKTIPLESQAKHTGVVANVSG